MISLFCNKCPLRSFFAQGGEKRTESFPEKKKKGGGGDYQHFFEGGRGKTFFEEKERGTKRGEKGGVMPVWPFVCPVPPRGGKKKKGGSNKENRRGRPSLPRGRLGAEKRKKKKEKERQGKKGGRRLAEKRKKKERGFPLFGSWSGPPDIEEKKGGGGGGEKKTWSREKKECFRSFPTGWLWTMGGEKKRKKEGPRSRLYNHAQKKGEKKSHVSFLPGQKKGEGEGGLPAFFLGPAGHRKGEK